jgi:hypothetical protein
MACGVTERLRRVSLAECGDECPSSPAYRATSVDPAREPGVRVRVLPYNGALSGKEGVVVPSSRRPGAHVAVAIEGEVRSLAETELEYVTVDDAAQTGTAVVVVSGAYRGCIGTLHSLAYADCACVTLGAETGGRVLQPRGICAMMA